MAAYVSAFFIGLVDPKLNRFANVTNKECPITQNLHFLRQIDKL